ncbi:MAG TPA: ABC transporter ATP-binding protein [Anaerolineales bacterium]|nr:ABC transporter ATP-binding protein [Anaerolineales bacterium]
MPDTIAIELRSVTKRFPNPSGGEVTAVDRASLEINDGEFFSLLGPSGCGKTTSLRMIAGFELPTEGEIFIHGKEMGQVPAFKRPVNTVFQQYALFPHMTIGQNVAFGLEMKGIARAERDRRVRETLELVQLPGMEKRKPKQLSGGQQQRVALARALVNRPEVLLLDEPLGALDLKLRKEMQLELKTLQREVGITFIYVTHDQEEALTMSDRIAVMNEGLILQIGEPEEIYESPHSKFVADFIGETNFLEGEVAGQDGGVVDVRLGSAGLIYMSEERGFSPGQRVTIAVRPEKLRLNAPLENGNNLPGVAEEIIYIGTDSHYRIRLPDGQFVRAREQNINRGSKSICARGDHVTVSFTRTAARVLTE